MTTGDNIHAEWEKLMVEAEACSKKGGHEQAEKLYEGAVELAERFGPEDIRLGRSLLHLGHLYSFLRSSAAAEPLLKRALSILDAKLQPGDPDLLSCVGDLAGMYFIQGRYAESEPLQKRFLAACERTLGLAHTKVAANLINLVTTLRKQRKYLEAEQLYVRWLEAGENALGPHDSYVIHIVEGLAELYDEQGKHPQAESLHRRLLVQERMLDVPMTYVAGRRPHKLGHLCANQGRASEAEDFFRQSIKIYERFSAYNDQAGVLEDLARLLRKTGRAREAKEADTQARTLREWHDMTH